MAIVYALADFQVYQGNGLPVEHGKQDLTGFGLKIQQGGNQHVRVNRYIDQIISCVFSPRIFRH